MLFRSQGADYVGVGPLRYTATKKKLSPVLGMEGYRRIMDRLREDGISMPVVAIGGVVPGDIRQLLKTGLWGAAFSGMLVRAPDPAALIRSLEEEIKKVIPC